MKYPLLILILSIYFLLVLIGYIIAFVIHTKKIKKEKAKRKDEMSIPDMEINELMYSAMVHSKN